MVDEPPGCEAALGSKAAAAVAAWPAAVAGVGPLLNPVSVTAEEDAERLNSRLCRCSTEVDALWVVSRNPLGLSICWIPSVTLLWMDRRVCIAVMAEVS